MAQDSGPIDFSSLGGNPTSTVAPPSAVAAAPPPTVSPNQLDTSSGPVNFSSLGGRPTNSNMSAAATATQTDTSTAPPEQPWYVNALNKVGEVTGKAIFGDNTAASAPLSPTQSSEVSGLTDIAQGNFTQGLSKIKHAEAIHVVAGSPIEKLIQKFKPDFVGGITPSQAEIEDRQNKAGLENPIIDAAQFIDKDQHPVLKALTEAAQSMTSPGNVAVMISTGGMGMVESPKALAVANRLISAGFTAQAVGQAYKNLKEFKTAYDKGDANDALYQLTHAVTSGTMAYLAGSHATGTPALEGAGQAASDAVGKAADTIKAAVDERAAKKANTVSGEDMISANKDFKKAIPSTKTNDYTDNDLIVANNYLEPNHKFEPIRSVQHTVDALDHSVDAIENKISEHVNIIPNEPISTDVLHDVQTALEQNERGDEFVKSGMKEIEGLDLGNMTMSRADNVRRQLNLENKRILKENDYDLAASRASSPGFAAREAAAASLRDGIYNQLEAHGIEGVRELRQEEGSLLKVRNAAQAQIQNGDKVIKGTGEGSPTRRLLGRGAVAAGTATGAGIGAAVGGVPGAIIGGGVGAEAGSMAQQVIVPPDLTRDETLERRFNKYKAATGQPGGVTVNLQAPPAPEVPVGAQSEIPPPIPKATPGTPEQPNLFGQTPTSASQQSPMVERQLLQQRIRPLQAILESPTATASEKIEAARQIAKLGLGQFANPEVPESGVSPEEKAEAAKASLNPTEATGESVPGSKTILETRQPDEYISPDTLKTPAREIPASSRPDGTTSQSVLEHEFGGHLANAAMEGFSADHIIGSEHPTAGRQTVAAAVVNWDGIDTDSKTGKLTPESVKDNIHKILSVTMGGAAQDALNGIPFETNKGISADLRFAKGVAKAVGFSPEETEQLINSGLERAKKNLTQPGMQDTIKSNAAIREDNLDPGLHASPERTRGLVSEFRRIHEQNGNTVGQAHGEGISGNGPGNATESAGNGQPDDAGREGPTAGTASKGVLETQQIAEPDVKISTDNNGIKWAEKDGIRVSIPNRIPETDIQEYASKKLDEQAEAQAAIKAKIGPEKSTFPGHDRSSGFIYPNGVDQWGYSHAEIVGGGEGEEGQVDNHLSATGAVRINLGASDITVQANGPLTEQQLSKIANLSKQFDLPKIQYELSGMGGIANSIGEFKRAYDQAQDLVPKVAKQASQDVKKGGGFVADLRTGKPTDTGFLVEMMPEKRQTLDHDATPKDIQKFYNDNRQLFKEHPELRIGGYKNELNISAHTENQPTAERLAKKLDQRSVWDVKKGQEIPTGGAGKQQKFESYPFEKRIKELRGQ